MKNQFYFTKYSPYSSKRLMLLSKKLKKNPAAQFLHGGIFNTHLIRLYVQRQSACISPMATNGAQ